MIEAEKQLAQYAKEYFANEFVPFPTVHDAVDVILETIGYVNLDDRLPFIEGVIDLLKKELDKDKEKIQIGYWWTYCCHLDLEEIKTEEDLQNIREQLEDDEPPMPGIWPTKLKALQEIRTRWGYYPDIQENEIDPMISRELDRDS